MLQIWWSDLKVNKYVAKLQGSLLAERWALYEYIYQTMDLSQKNYGYSYYFISVGSSIDWSSDKNATGNNGAEDGTTTEKVSTKSFDH